MSIRDQWTIFYMLLLRQWFVICKQLPNMFGDGLVVVSLQIIMLKYFLPAMGMSFQWQFPLFIGNMLMLCFTIGYQYGLGITNDIATHKVIHYHASLPLSPQWAVLSYLCGAIMSFFVLLVPVGCIGGFFLNASAQLNGSFFAIALMLTLNIIFCTHVYLSFNQVYAKCIP